MRALGGGWPLELLSCVDSSLAELLSRLLLLETGVFFCETLLGPLVGPCAAVNRAHT